MAPVHEFRSLAAATAAAAVGSQPTRVIFAQLLGYASISSWLCAQLPQVFKNLKLRSCDGLALPFLVNWLFGDITNFVGCLLTDQLPFQTYLAAYFCVVDFTLLFQFFHYRSKRPLPPQTPRYLYNSVVASPRQSLILPPSSAPPHHRSASGSSLHPHVTAGPSRVRAKRNPYSQYPSTSSGQYFPPDIAVTSPGGGIPRADASYQAIYEAALDVARAAERVSQKRSASRRRKLSRQVSSASSGMQDVDENEMTESFHSDMSGRSGSTRGTAPNSPRATEDAEGRRRMAQSTGTLLDARGRSRSRKRNLDLVSPYREEREIEPIDGLPAPGSGLGLTQVLANAQHQEMREAKRSKSRSLSLVRGSGGRGGRRAAGMAFMSIGMLVGWGGFTGMSSGRQEGQVLAGPARQAWPEWEIPRYPVPLTSIPASTIPTTSSDNYPLHLTQVRLYDNDDNENERLPSHPPHPPEEPPSVQRIVGRISAWSCTTLYLTSRLPQIWMNFQRKSVEGLSILLFIFAFLGNVTYVLSILLNPAGEGDPAEATHYLLEALPYLLGSAGTLVFDLTIMIQSVVYGSAPPIPIPTHGGGGSGHGHLDRHGSFGGSVPGAGGLRRKKRLLRSAEEGPTRGRGRSREPPPPPHLHSHSERSPLLSTTSTSTGSTLTPNRATRSPSASASASTSTSINSETTVGPSGSWGRGRGRKVGETIAALPTVNSHSVATELGRGRSLSPQVVAGGPGGTQRASPVRTTK